MFICKQLKIEQGNIPIYKPSIAYFLNNKPVVIYIKCEYMDLSNDFVIVIKYTVYIGPPRVPSSLIAERARGVTIDFLFTNKSSHAFNNSYIIYDVGLASYKYIV